MDRYRIALIVGSLRRDSLNRKVARALVNLGPPDLTFQESVIADLPLFDQDGEKSPPAPVRRFKQEISSSQGVLFVTPEYNRSVPGVLKNAIDHGSRPYGDNSWAGKPAGVLGVSMGAIGTALAQQHLRNVLAYLDAPALGQPEAFIQMKEGLVDETGSIGPASREFLQGWMDRYAAWVRKHQG